MADPGKNGELPEFPVRGPFGGIQSELPLDMIEGLGFANALNVMFYKGATRVRPKLQADIIPASPLLVRIQDLQGQIGQQAWYPDGQPFVYGHAQYTDGSIGYVYAHLPPSGPPIAIWTFVKDDGVEEAWTGIYDFFDVSGSHVQVATTTTQFYYNSGSGWVRLFGVLDATSGIPPSFTVVGQKLCMTNGGSKIVIWDGAADKLTVASPDAVPAKYLFEFGNHLVALNTLEGGSRAYQRVHWSGAGDPTDWDSFNSGQTDLYNDLGPINGGLKLFEYGYVFQQFGIVQMQLTGIGTQPFYFQAVPSRAKGLVIPRSLASNGESTCFYVGQDNVYSFDGTNSAPVGDMPYQGRARLGARSRIFADIALCDPSLIFGFVSNSVNGRPFSAYWLVIPNVTIWVYHIDDMTWTRWTVTGVPTCIGNYLTQTPIRIIDLIGTIAQQQWSPATLLNDNPYPAVMIGMADGSSILFDFTGWSEQPWYVETGDMEYGDQRHEETTRKLRLTYKDNGPCQISLAFTNEDGEVYENTPLNPQYIVLDGNNTGRSLKTVLPVNLSGKYIKMHLSGDAEVPFEMSSYAPIYSPGGEVKNAL